MRKYVGLSACALAMLLALSACSSSGTGSGTSAATTPTAGSGTGSGAPDLSALRAAVEKYVNPPASIGITTPLTRKPPTGKTVYFIQNNLADSASVTGGVTAAAKALGWSEKTLVFDPNNPAAVNSAVEQAVQQGASYIAIIGANRAAYQAGALLAKQKHVPIVVGFTAGDEVGWPDQGLYGNIGGDRFQVELGNAASDYNIVLKNGHANIAFVTLPVYTNLTVNEGAAKAELLAKCPTCTFGVINVSTDQMAANQVPQLVLSYLRTHKGVNVIEFVIGALATGVAPVLSSAGYGNVALMGTTPQQPNFTALTNGTAVAWLDFSNSLAGWYMVDVMARLSVGMDATANVGVIPVQIITKDNIPPNQDNYEGVPGYPAQFKTLWKVSG